jgi:NAD(P)-dependent dehydrogenase (short-subunit alcohol dehydrogenase family)
MTGVVERGIAEFGHIDIAAINHGIAVPGRWDTPVEVIDDILAVNLKGALIAARSVIPHMIERGGGSIVLTSSTAGIGPSPGLVAYSMSKHGVIGLMRCLSADLAQHRIRVNAICPGSVRTDMLMNDSVISMFCGVPTGGTPERAEFAARSLNLLPEPWSGPRDISNAVAFLASDDARTITGIVMPVDLGNSNQPSGVPPIAAAALAASAGGTATEDS